MKSAAAVSFTLAATLALSACSSENGGPMGMDSNQTLGTGAGAAAGGLAGFLITGGPIAWAQAVDGSVVMSLRGGDFELTLGEDFAIGFVAADAERVQLYLEESLAFRSHSPEAAVVLAHQT